jgi:uncharacterized peroxidase-related enzyme
VTLNFPLHDETSAPPEAQPGLATTMKNFGMIPNLERVMATAPALLKGYSSLWDLFDETSLTPIERQVVYQVANFENECTYCVPWHSWLSEEADMSQSDIEALRAGRSLTNPRLEALRAFTQAVVVNRGHVDSGTMDAFFDAGYCEQQVLEVVLGIAVKVMSNYTNAMAGTPLEKSMQKYAWQKPAEAKAGP